MTVFMRTHVFSRFFFSAIFTGFLLLGWIKRCGTPQRGNVLSRASLSPTFHLRFHFPFHSSVFFPFVFFSSFLLSELCIQLLFPPLPFLSVFFFFQKQENRLSGRKSFEITTLITTFFLTSRVSAHQHGRK